MANIHQHLVKSTVFILLVGCASAPPEKTSDNLAGGQPQITPMKPDSPLSTQPYPNITLGAQGSRDYYAASLSGTYGSSSALRGFIRQMVQKHGFSENYLYGLFSTAQRLDSVIKLESPAPSTAPSKPSKGSWTRYRNKFLTDAHINSGVEFWRNNAFAVERASTTYGVDPEYIIAIIGVETYFGKNFGKTSIFDALTTLSFDTYRRSSFFMSELEHFLLMAREEGLDPRKPVGSWAGAMGFGQFMPSSFRRLAVDFDNNGRRDIWDPEDAIGSVAHYFSRSGWHLHSPVANQYHPANDDSVIELSTYEGNEYWRVHPNFKVIKKYNNSNKYAMAVHQLAQAIKQRFQGG